MKNWLRQCYFSCVCISIKPQHSIDFWLTAMVAARLTSNHPKRGDLEPQSHPTSPSFPSFELSHSSSRFAALTPPPRCVLAVRIGIGYIVVTATSKAGTTCGTNWSCHTDPTNTNTCRMSLGPWDFLGFLFSWVIWWVFLSFLSLSCSRRRWPARMGRFAFQKRKAMYSTDPNKIPKIVLLIRP